MLGGERPALSDLVSNTVYSLQSMYSAYNMMGHVNKENMRFNLSTAARAYEGKEI